MGHDIRQLGADEFPSFLREIPDPPKQLYIRGTLPAPGAKYLTVVGSRRYSNYGKEACESLIAGLSGYPIAIVSGLAIGIDSIAHRAALKARIPTIAIPGSGLGWDVLYPASHKGLARQILEVGGALLSEFEKDFRATPYSFPQRNRIMAGISHAVLVIEAGERSGTLVTSRLASEYNRDVLTIPHSIFSHSSHGPHMLMRLGAVPIRHSADILEALSVGEEAKTSPDASSLSKEEQKIVEILQEPMSRDALIERLDIPVSEANMLLTTMELKELIKEQLGEIHLK